ncbi:hypothetical protein HYU17_00605 [Candidatus Woesearchaeota archaeon]|nr:hypothetical protein [Candidatus Woesearchaeota archaeon]
MRSFAIGKKGQEATTWGHLGGWIIALGILIMLLVFAAAAFGVVDLGFIREMRFG